MVANFSQDPGINYAPLNLGQLKALAKPFYDVMHSAEGFTIVLADGTVIQEQEYPWNPTTPPSENYAPANLGQLKYVFSFYLANWLGSQMPSEEPPGWEDVPDSWKQQIVDADPNDAITDISQVHAYDDFEPDGLTNYMEYCVGADPTSVNAISADSSHQAAVVVWTIAR